MKKMKLTSADYCVRLVPLPGDINGVVRLSPDGFANIYINDCLSREAQKKAVAHELRHIVNNDFYSDRSITEVENDAEG